MATIGSTAREFYENLTPYRTEYVLGFAFDRNRREVLLIRKNRPDWMVGKLNGVGGKVEIGETPREAMLREFSEETGLSAPNSHDWQHCGVLYGEKARIWVYRCHTFRGSFDTKTSDDWGLYNFTKATDEQPFVINVDDLPKSVVPNVRWLIPLLAEPNVVEFSVSIDPRS